MAGLSACEGWAAWQEQRATQALADSRLDEANQFIDRALWVRQRRMSTLLLAARIRRLSGAYTEAEHYLERCGQLHGMTEPVQLEWLLLRCQQGEIDALAPNLLVLVRQDDPEAPAILETLASVYMRQTRYLEALDCLNRWLERNPESVRGLDWRGWVNNQLDHLEQAVHDHEYLLELRPERTDIRLRLAQILIAGSRHLEAVPHLERLRRELPDNPDVAAALAPCRFIQSRPEEARELLDAVLRDHPEHFDALFQRGKLELALGNSTDAEPRLRKALKINPHDLEVLYSLYRCLQEQPDRQEEAQRLIERWDQEGKKKKRLTSLLRKDLAANPNDVELAREAGELFLHFDEDKHGLFWLHRALLINPNHTPSRRALLAYYERTNQLDKAEEQRRELEKLR